MKSAQQRAAPGTLDVFYTVTERFSQHAFIVISNLRISFQKPLITVHLVFRGSQRRGAFKVPLAFIEIILTPSRTLRLLQIALHVHHAAVGGVGLPLEPLHCAVEERHAQRTLRHAVQEHKVMLLRAPEELGGEERHALCDVGAAFTVGVPGGGRAGGISKSKTAGALWCMVGDLK